VSAIRQSLCVASWSAIAVNWARSSESPYGSESASTSWRVKNQPVSRSVW